MDKQLCRLLAFQNLVMIMMIMVVKLSYPFYKHRVCVTASLSSIQKFVKRFSQKDCADINVIGDHGSHINASIYQYTQFNRHAGNLACLLGHPKTE